MQLIKHGGGGQKEEERKILLVVVRVSQLEQLNRHKHFQIPSVGQSNISFT